MYTLIQVSFYTGLMIGGWSGCRRAALQFHAEHQHALPGIQSRPELSAFLRLRNARVLLGGICGGVRRGLQLAAVASLFGGLKWAAAAGREAGGLRDDALPLAGHLDELAAAVGTGLAFALAAGRTERMHMAGRGARLGAIFGAILVTLRSLHDAQQRRQQTVL